MESWRRKMKPWSRSWGGGERTAADRGSIRGAAGGKGKLKRCDESKRTWGGRGVSALFDAIMCLLMFSIHTSSCVLWNQWMSHCITHTHSCVRALNIRYKAIMLSWYPEKNIHVANLDTFSPIQGFKLFRNIYIYIYWGCKKG